MARLEAAPTAELVGVGVFLRLLAAGLTPHLGRSCSDFGDVGLAPAVSAGPPVPAVVRTLDFVLISLAITDDELRFGDVSVPARRVPEPDAVGVRPAGGVLRAVLFAFPPARKGAGLSYFVWTRFGVVDCASIATRGSGLFFFCGEEGVGALLTGVFAWGRGRGEADGIPGTFRLPGDSIACTRAPVCSNAPNCGIDVGTAVTCRSGSSGPLVGNEAADAADR